MTDALVLSGAVVRGAFTAGALSVLMDPDVAARLALSVTRIVGASSGALNATYLAAAIRAGTAADATQRLVQIWLDDASITRAFDFSLRDVVRELGLSTDDSVMAILRKNIAPGGGSNPIDLRIVVTNADGEPIPVGGAPATTFEHVYGFSGPDFDTAASLERVFVATAASAALPGLFAPVAMQVDGRAVRGLDGGLVEDTPVGKALDGAPEIDRVFVVAPFPRIRAAPSPLAGIGLASHVLDIVVDERLVRDLRRVDRVNRVLEQLPSLLPDAAQRRAVLDALGWSERRIVKVVEIRPDAELPGNAFEGFASRSLREGYVKAGADAARAVLASLS